MIYHSIPRLVHTYHLSGLQDPRLFPSFPKCTDSHGGVRLAFDVLYVQQVIFPSEREKVRKERVKVRLRAEMQDLSEMSMINVCKDAEELAIDVFDGGRKRCVECLICKAMSDGQKAYRPRRRVDAYWIWLGTRSRLQPVFEGSTRRCRCRTARREE
jgi:hypothetical protein